MPDENGLIEKPLDPALHITWDDESKSVQIACDRRVYQNPDFIIAVLSMARSAIEDSKRQATVQGMMRRAEDARVNEAIKQSILKR